MKMVEHTRLELVTFALPVQRAPNCANAPHGDSIISHPMAFVKRKIEKMRKDFPKNFCGEFPKTP